MCKTHQFDQRSTVKIRFPFFKSNFTLIQQHWLVPSALLCSLKERRKSDCEQNRGAWLRLNVHLGTGWWVWSTHYPSACIRSPFCPKLVLQRRYLSIPSVPGLFPCCCNGLVSVSLNHNIWNGIIMNSRPHSSSVPWLPHTNCFWISIHLLCFPQVFSFHHWKINICKLEYCD